jgi:hypothetical protein
MDFFRSLVSPQFAQSINQFCHTFIHHLLLFCLGFEEAMGAACVRPSVMVPVQTDPLDKKKNVDIKTSEPLPAQNQKIILTGSHPILCAVRLYGTFLS